MEHQGRVVLITGGAQGIGAGIARCFASEGARVVITDLDENLVHKSAAELGNGSFGLVADAANRDAMAVAVDIVIERFSKLDVLVNNAGGSGPKAEVVESSPTTSPFQALNDETWDRQVMFNLRTAFSSTSAAADRLEAGGSVINIASITGLTASTIAPAYGAAKAGVVHLTKTLAVELAPGKSA